MKILYISSSYNKSPFLLKNLSISLFDNYPWFNESMHSYNSCGVYYLVILTFNLSKLLYSLISRLISYANITNIDYSIYPRAGYFRALISLNYWSVLGNINYKKS